MSILFHDESQRELKLPTEIWNVIFDFCLDQHPLEHGPSLKTISKVLALVSKEINKIALSVLPSQTATRIHYRLATYLIQKGFASLLRYAADNKLTLPSTSINEAAYCGSMGCIKVLEERGFRSDQTTLREAARKGRLNIAEYIVQQGIQPDKEVIGRAVASGNVDLLKFLQKHFNGTEAAKSGNLEMVKYIEQFVPLQRNGMIGACLSGSIEVAQYYMTKGFVLKDAEILAAAEEGHFDLVKFAINHGAPMSAVLMSVAVKKCDLELIKDLHLKGCPWNGSSISAAAMTGRLAALKYLIENGCPYTIPPLTNNLRGTKSSVSAIEQAAKNNHFDCLKYLIEHNAPSNPHIINISVTSDHATSLAMIKYLHDRGETWDVKTSALAAKMGNLELLKYLHENGCPWDEKTCFWAAQEKRPDCLNCIVYALDNGCPWDSRLMQSALGSLEMLQLFHEKGVAWNTDTCDKLFRSGNVELLKYAHENGAPWSADTFLFGLGSRNPVFACFKYAVENGCPLNQNETLLVAQEYEHTDVVEWILKNSAVSIDSLIEEL